MRPPSANSRQPSARPGAGKPAAAWRFAPRALGHRNYRLFFSGQSVPLVGTWMTRVATSSVVYRLTHRLVALTSPLASDSLASGKSALSFMFYEIRRATMAVGRR